MNTIFEEGRAQDPSNLLAKPPMSFPIKLNETLPQVETYCLVIQGQKDDGTGKGPQDGFVLLTQAQH